MRTEGWWCFIRGAFTFNSCFHFSSALAFRNDDSNLLASSPFALIIARRQKIALRWRLHTFMHVMLVFSHGHSEKISTQEKFGKRKKRQPGYRRVHAGENWKSFSDNRLNYDDDFSILCRFLRADVETKFQPFLFKLLHRSAKNVKLHNLLFRCFSFLKRNAASL